MSNHPAMHLVYRGLLYQNYLGASQVNKSGEQHSMLLPHSHSVRQNTVPQFQTGQSLVHKKRERERVSGRRSPTHKDSADCMQEDTNAVERNQKTMQNLMV